MITIFFKQYLHIIITNILKRDRVIILFFVNKVLNLLNIGSEKKIVGKTVVGSLIREQIFDKLKIKHFPCHYCIYITINSWILTGLRRTTLRKRNQYAYRARL